MYLAVVRTEEGVDKWIQILRPLLQWQALRHVLSTTECELSRKHIWKQGDIIWEFDIKGGVVRSRDMKVGKTRNNRKDVISKCYS